MGAKCSHYVNERYEIIKNEAKKAPCMKLYAVDGLISKKDGKPIFFMGEHHDIIEEGDDCLTVSQILKNSVSSNCQTHKAHVYFLYETPIISNNPLFQQENPSMPFFDGQEELDNIQGTRFNIMSYSKDFKNIQPQPMEIFGRMRYFNLNREIRNHVHTQQVAINELKEFWKNINYPDEFISFIGPKAMTLAEETTDVFFSKFPQSLLTRTEVLEVFTCTSLAKLSLVVNKDTPESSIGKDFVMKYCDNFIEIFMSDEPELYNPEQFADLVGEIEEIRYSIRIFLMFELIAIAGDMITYEHISNINNENMLLIMHAGVNHTNRIRKWLLVSEYDSDFERVSNLALDDMEFNLSR